MPLLGTRLKRYVADAGEAVFATKEVPVARLGISPGASGTRNAKALDAAIARVDPGTIIKFGSDTYALEAGIVRQNRGDFELRGDGYERTLITYESSFDGQLGTGVAVHIGPIDPLAEAARIAGDATKLIRNVTVRGIGFHDRNVKPFPIDGSRPAPSALETVFVENLLVDRCAFWNVKGNAGATLIGLAQDNTTPVTRLTTVQHCRFGGDEAGGWNQGDGVNAGGMYELVLRGNVTSGGVQRHFMEAGAAIHVLTVEDNVGDLKGQGIAHIGSFTVCERASIRRNTFSNWGAYASAIAVNPDLPTLPIHNLECEDNILSATPDIWSAAIGVVNGQLSNHAYRRNTFIGCLPFYLAKQPKDGCLIEENDATRARRTFIATNGEPTETVEVRDNHLAVGAQLFDRVSWSRHRLVKGVETNVRGG